MYKLLLLLYLRSSLLQIVLGLAHITQLVSNLLTYTLLSTAPFNLPIPKKVNLTQFKCFPPSGSIND